MTQDDITRVLTAAREGTKLVVSYESPRGERRFGIPITSVKHDAEGNVQRVNLECGTAAWMFVKRRKLDGDELRWCLFQPNPYPIHEVAVEAG